MAAGSTTYNMYNNDICLQKYLSLQNQKEMVLQRSSIAFISPFSTSTPEWSSNQSTPMGVRSGYGFPASYESHSTSAPIPTSYPAPTVPFGQRSSRARSISDPDQENDNSRALYNINQQIKAALTELLNTDSVRNNDNYRTFVQGKLMEAEIEMKGQRRRRSSEVSSGNVALASSIKSGLELSL